MVDSTSNLSKTIGRIQKTLDLCHETNECFDFADNNSDAYLEGYAQGEHDFQRVYLNPGQKAPAGRKTGISKSGKPYYETQIRGKKNTDYTRGDSKGTKFAPKKEKMEYIIPKDTGNAEDYQQEPDNDEMWQPNDKDHSVEDERIYLKHKNASVPPDTEIYEDDDGRKYIQGGVHIGKDGYDYFGRYCNKDGFHSKSGRAKKQKSNAGNPFTTGGVPVPLRGRKPNAIKALAKGITK